jgi:hypothetical protein
MTHSARVAAMTNNKRFGEDAERNPSVRHRMAWLRKEHSAGDLAANPVIERALRERIA